MSIAKLILCQYIMYIYICKLLTWFNFYSKVKSLKIPKGGNQNPYIEEEKTTQWPKEKVQKDKQRSTKHTYKTKDQVTRTPLKTEGERRCSGRVSSSCSTIGTRRVNLVTNSVINREWGEDQEVLTTSGTYPWSFLTQIFNLNSLNWEKNQNKIKLKQTNKNQNDKIKH
jgi:hypothetical protein